MQYACVHVARLSTRRGGAQRADPRRSPFDSENRRPLSPTPPAAPKPDGAEQDENDANAGHGDHGDDLSVQKETHDAGDEKRRADLHELTRRTRARDLQGPSL